MKLITFISTGAFILFTAFVMKKENVTQQTSLYDTRWELRKIHFPDSIETVMGRAFIQFNQAKKSAGGNGGCNGFGSTVTVSGNRIGFRDIFSTKMYCEGIQPAEDAFFSRLEKADRFEIKNKTLLLYRGKEVLLEFDSK